ncbi:MAG: hypothetical protein P1P84_12375 [Deferrisomatales bacterium]|nr:hypothetical protein [Deferrisomatales bacterium]
MKLAACFGSDVMDHATVISDMTHAQCLSEQQESMTFKISHGNVGCVIGSDRFSSIPLIRKGPNGNLLMISGVPIYMQGSLDCMLQEIAESNYQTAANLLTSLDGAFVALFWDGQEQKLVVVSDCFGLQPLNIVHRKGLFLLATELKAFPSSGLVQTELDTAAWGAFFSLGFNIGDHTQLAGVTRVEPATVMVYDPAKESLESSVYWSLPKPRPEMTLDDVDLGEMLQILQREIECYASHRENGTVLLSGGFDSRLILSLLKRLDIACEGLILKVPYKAFGNDGRYGEKIARRLGCPFKTVHPPKDYFSSSSYLRYLAIDEVTVQSLVGHMVIYVAEHLKPEMGAVWEGLGPGFAFAPGYPLTGGFSTYLKDRCRDIDTQQWQAVQSVFSKSVWQAMYENFRELLMNEIGKFTDDDFGTARFQIANQMRYYLANNPTTVYAHTVLPFTPGLSKDLWNLAGSIPLSLTSDMKLYFKLYADYLPEAKNVPFCSGGRGISNKTFTPLLDAEAKLASMDKYIRYYKNRLNRKKGIGPILNKLGLKSNVRNEYNPLIEEVIRRIDPGHPLLNAESVLKLQKDEPPYSWPSRLGRRTLFYWQTWQWIMEGKLSTANASTFLKNNY